MSIFEFGKPGPARVVAPPPAAAAPDDSAKRRLLEVRGFSELVGQAECIRRLKAFGDLYASKNAVPEHILLTGAEGMGKATFARAFAKSYNTGLRGQPARGINKTGDLTRHIICSDQNEALVMADIQDLRQSTLDVLRTAMRDFRIDVVLPNRVFPYQTNRFTLIATAQRLSDVPLEILKGFSLSIALQPYSVVELEQIAGSFAKASGLGLMKGVAPLIVSVANGNPGTVEELIRRLSRLEKACITEAEATQALSAFGLKPSIQVIAGTALNAEDLDKLTGVEFERLITAMLQRMGFQAEMTKATGDGGIDIVAHLEKPFVGGRYLVQCKRFAPEVLIGAATVREFYGAFVADRKAIKGIFITTSAFTAQAYEFAESLPLELIDGTRLKQLLTEQVGLPAGEIHPRRALFS